MDQSDAMMKREVALSSRSGPSSLSMNPEVLAVAAAAAEDGGESAVFLSLLASADAGTAMVGCNGYDRTARSEMKAK